MKPTILFVDDDQAMCELVDATLRPLDMEVVWFTEPVDALDHLRVHPVDVVLTDLRMRGMTGLEVCQAVRSMRPGVPVIVMTGFGSMDTAIEAIRAGAYDFLPKPVDLDVLEITVRRAVEHAQLTSEVRRLRERTAPVAEHGLIGHSPAFRRVLELLPRAARADVPLLIEGETGTGKELMARALHDASLRADEPFIAVNCAAIPESLVESELFGHVKGSFTDARADRAGLFVQAGRGTLFLDEFGELPLPVQAKLLRALQEGRIRPVGADREVSVVCRVIASTNRDLVAEAKAGRFRMDLYYRVAVIRLAMPPLRERAGDILVLAHHFVGAAAQRMNRRVEGVSTAAAQALLAYAWPGNVRELENVMERAVALTEHTLIVPDDLPAELWEAQQPPESRVGALVPLDDVERDHILRVLDAVQGNKSAAAEVLQVDRRTLYRKLERYEQEDV